MLVMCRKSRQSARAALKRQSGESTLCLKDRGGLMKTPCPESPPSSAHLRMGLHVTSFSTITLQRRYNYYPHFKAKETETGRDVSGRPFHESGLITRFSQLTKGRTRMNSQFWCRSRLSVANMEW